MNIKTFQIKPMENMDIIVNNYISDKLSTNTIHDIDIFSFYIPSGANYGINHTVLVKFS